MLLGNKRPTPQGESHQVFNAGDLILKIGHLPGGLRSDRKAKRYL